MSSGVTAVAGGIFYGLAIRNGAAFAWGLNERGQLGNGTNTNSNVPVPVSGMSSGVTAIAPGEAHCLAIQNGAVWAWGGNGAGQLGNGTNTHSNVPVPVTGMSSGVTDVAAGSSHSLAIRNGDVYVWGSNGFGALGNGTTVGSSNVPVLALDLDVDLIDVAGGNGSSFALSSDGSLWVWGRNNLGQLGLGDNGNRLTPTQLLPPDGFVFTFVASNFGENAVAILTPVPEPSSNLLATFAGAAAWRRWRRRPAVDHEPTCSTDSHTCRTPHQY